jgi:prepilin-type N-terminal cleavage/methylation domain-containing protein
MMKIKTFEGGFTLVELAVVLVIIGLIVAGIASGKGTMQEAGLTKLYKTKVVPCTVEAIRRNTGNPPEVTMGGVSADLSGCHVKIGDDNYPIAKIGKIVSANNLEDHEALRLKAKKKLKGGDYVVSDTLTLAGDINIKAIVPE